NTGLYCETVMKTRQPLLVPDALSDEAWKPNPDIKLGMISYLGVPITWPDGETFGTICVLDNKANEYSDLYLRLLLQWRDVVEADLRSLATLHSKLEEREAKIRRLFDANIIGIFIWELEGQITEANDAFLQMLGYDREDLVCGRLRWTDLTPPEWFDLDIRRWIPELKTTGSLQPFEKEYFRKDGGRIPRVDWSGELRKEWEPRCRFCTRFDGTQAGGSGSTGERAAIPRSADGSGVCEPRCNDGPAHGLDRPVSETADYPEGGQRPKSDA